MISPSKHHHTSILIDDVHLHEFHFGDDHVLSCVRNLGYWPINGRNAVRARSIFRCKKQHAQPLTK